MSIWLTDEQVARGREVRAFAEREILPHAAACDRDQRLPDSLLRALIAAGCLGSVVHARWGGPGWDMVSYGLLHQEIGRVLSSAAAIITVHDMAAHAIGRWGSPGQQQAWLPALARGERLGALAVSEAEAGSDVRAVTMSAVRRGASFVLNGTKKWVTAGQIADLYIVLAKVGHAPTAFFIERDRPGVSTRPVTGMLGFRAAMLADVTFEDCEIPEDHLLARVNFGVESVISTALDLGRYSVASNAAGVLQACVDASGQYAHERRQAGVALAEHQLVSQMLSNMIADAEAAALLCWRAGRARDLGDPDAMRATLVAKYVASRAAVRAALDTIQIHGANGCSDEWPVQRYLRDAKIMEIIEGSTQIQQVLIAQLTRREPPRDRRMPPPHTATSSVA